MFIIFAVPLGKRGMTGVYWNKLQVVPRPYVLPVYGDVPTSFDAVESVFL